MATQSPFSFLEDIVQKTGANFQPPAWLVDEVQRRIVLLLNHVLMQEKEATIRLARQKGRTVLFQWRAFTLLLTATPAGLLELAAPASEPELTLTVTEASALTLAQAMMRGDKPAVRIEGDVQLAADLNWLADHVRWDVEEDMARIVGDAPAHALAQAARRMAEALREFLTRKPGQRKPDGNSP